MEKSLEILLVEDSPADVRLTQEALKDINIQYNLTVVNDGEDAMTYLNKQKKIKLPDVILLDLNLPRKNGHEVMEEIKNDEIFEQIPVVVLTVSQDEEDVLKALDLKMNYYINKPVNSNRLGAVLQMINEF